VSGEPGVPGVKQIRSALGKKVPKERRVGVSWGSKTGGESFWEKFFSREKEHFALTDGNRKVEGGDVRWERG